MIFIKAVASSERSVSDQDSQKDFSSPTWDFYFPSQGSSNCFNSPSPYRSDHHRVCFRCLLPGHLKRECKNKMKCLFCDKLGHSRNRCFSLQKLLGWPRGHPLPAKLLSFLNYPLLKLKLLNSVVSKHSRVKSKDLDSSVLTDFSASNFSPSSPSPRASSITLYRPNIAFLCKDRKVFTNLVSKPRRAFFKARPRPVSAFPSLFRNLGTFTDSLKSFSPYLSGSLSARDTIPLSRTSNPPAHPDKAILDVKDPSLFYSYPCALKVSYPLYPAISFHHPGCLFSWFQLLGTQSWLHQVLRTLKLFLLTLPLKYSSSTEVPSSPLGADTSMTIQSIYSDTPSSLSSPPCPTPVLVSLAVLEAFSPPAVRVTHSPVKRGYKKKVHDRSKIRVSARLLARKAGALSAHQFGQC